MTYPNGDCFEGHFVSDNREGYGVMKLHRGDVYEGEWWNDQMHGNGILRHYEGSVYQGRWENGNKVEQLGVYQSSYGM